ncbi:MAG: hypothetical protein M0018_02850 [Nitrospiraceae bacterium]|nr:hypothetical protein [Nitrospiraceae bacterium]
MATSITYQSNSELASNGNAGIKEKAGQYARTMAEEQKLKLAKKMDILAAAIAETAGQLKTQDDGQQVSGYLISVSDSMERASGYLRKNTIEDLYEAAINQIRSRPALVLGGALITGYILARLMKNTKKA